MRLGHCSRNGGLVPTLRERVIEALGSYVGDTVADTCVRATALSIGKTADDLTGEDIAALESNMRRLLGPVAPASVVDQVIETLKGAM